MVKESEGPRIRKQVFAEVQRFETSQILQSRDIAQLIPRQIQIPQALDRGYGMEIDDAVATKVQAFQLG